MKGLIITILIILAVVLFGTFPLSVLANILDVISYAIKWLAKTLDIFNWNGII